MDLVFSIIIPNTVVTGFGNKSKVISIVISTKYIKVSITDVIQVTTSIN